MAKISRGKLAGFRALANRKGIIVALALDSAKPETKTSLIATLGSQVSAIAIHPTDRVPSVKSLHPQTGVLFSVQDDLGAIRLAKEQGAQGIRLSLSYSPLDESKLNQEKQNWIERFGRECTTLDLLLALELRSSGLGTDEKGLEFAKAKPEIVSGQIREFSKPSYSIDLLIPEIPINPKFAESTRGYQGTPAYSHTQSIEIFRRTSDLAGKPFLYSACDLTVDATRDCLELAWEARSRFSGVVCGEPIWAEGLALEKQNAEAWNNWLKDRAVRNLRSLHDILDRTAYSWMQFYGGKIEEA